MKLQTIAHFQSPFPSKFGIPKQSGLVEELEGTIVFKPAFRQPDYLRGIEAFDRLWLLWEFSANPHAAHSPLVRPPRLGGNERVGVFASRSPFRPNPIALSCVRLIHVDWDTPQGPVLHIGGADLMDGTPIIDIKPYIVYADAHPDAQSGFVDSHQLSPLNVILPASAADYFTPQELLALKKVLAEDPRPHYHNDPTKLYGMAFARHNVRFSVNNNELRVIEIEKL